MKEEYPFPWREPDPKTFTKHYLLARFTEAQVQADILKMLALYQVDAVPIDAGGRRQRGRIAGAAAAAGVDLKGVSNVKTGGAIPAGYADLEATLAPCGRALFIEIKAPRWIDGKMRTIKGAGKPSAAQLDFLMEKHRRGAVVMVAWSYFEVEKYCYENLALNRQSLSVRP